MTRGRPDEDLPATVVSTTMQGPLDWPDGADVRGDAVARLKQKSEVSLRSHGSLPVGLLQHTVPCVRQECRGRVKLPGAPRVAQAPAESLPSRYGNPATRS